MVSKGQFLKSIYTDAAITAALEEAINIKFQLHIIDNRNGHSFPLDIQHLVQIRQNHPHRVFVRLEEPVEVSLGGIHRVSGSVYEQPVGYSDLRADEVNLALIKAMFKPNIASSLLADQPKVGVDAGAVEYKPIEAEPEEQNEDEMEESYWTNPADRDPWLFEEAIRLKIANPSWNLMQIHKEIHSNEKGKSNVSIDLLKHIVKLKKLNQVVKRRIAMEEKRKVNE